MKTIRILFLMAFILSFIHGFSILKAQEWSKAIHLSPGTNPDLFVDSENGNLHIVAIIEKKGVIYLKTDKLGNTLDSLIVPNTHIEEGMLKYGPTIAIDSKDFPHIGFREYDHSAKYDVYYTHQTENGWTTPLNIAEKVLRGYVVRMAIDNNDLVHFAHGSVTDETTNTGPVNYYILQNGSIIFEQYDIMRIRGDERFELDVSPDNVVDLVCGDLSYPSEGGPIFYWRSRSDSNGLDYKGDLHDVQARGGANGSPDLFVDAAGYTHVCYGAEIDNSISGEPSIRYHRLENGITQYDVRVTDRNEISITGIVPIGIASVAAGKDGQKVIVAYTTDENGPLYTRISDDGGKTWQEPQYLADGWNSAEARNKHIIRAYRDDFYVVFPTENGIYLRYLKLTPNELPIAKLGTPEQSLEGSPTFFNATSSYDPDGNIIDYYWDFQNDGIYDDTTTVPIDSFTYVDDFSGEAKLKVIDNDGDSDSVTVSVLVNNVAPLANAGGSYTGDWYTAINIHGEAFDPGLLDTLTFEWDVDDDGIFETIGQDAQTPAYTQGDSHWVVLRVSDDDGGVDIDSALIIINNQSPSMSNILDQIINEGENFTPIQLDAFVNDPDNPDSTISWSFLGLNNLSISLTEKRIATITPKDPRWSGFETITFVATDPGGKSDRDSATFTINAVNDPPLISDIPAQSRFENELFTDINLDNYVNDPDNHDSTMIWNSFDEDYFSVNIIERIASVAVIDSEWAGTDTIGFVASDPQGLKDTAFVTYTIIAINDPPVVTPIEDQSIYQDQEFPLIALDDHVFDPDYPDSLIVWTFAGSNKLDLYISPARILQVSHPDTTWFGSEIIVFWATDDEGLYDLFSTTFTVKQGVDVENNKKESIPDNFVLYPNYPNPFNPHTCISYDIAKQSDVTLKIYNELGHEVRSLIEQTHEPGSYRVIWNGKDNQGQKVSSGVYFYRIKAGSFSQTMKMILIL